VSDLTNRLKEGLADEFDIPVLDFSQIENPQFDKIPYGNSPHDWRVYIPDICIKLWDELSNETKMSLYAIAQYQVHNEVWD
jgi:hypothetical protein